MLAVVIQQGIKQICKVEDCLEQAVAEYWRFRDVESSTQALYSALCKERRREGIEGVWDFCSTKPSNDLILKEKTFIMKPFFELLEQGDVKTIPIIQEFVTLKLTEKSQVMQILMRSEIFHDLMFEYADSVDANLLFEYLIQKTKATGKITQTSQIHAMNSKILKLIKMIAVDVSHDEVVKVTKNQETTKLGLVIIRQRLLAQKIEPWMDILVQFESEMVLELVELLYMLDRNQVMEYSEYILRQLVQLNSIQSLELLRTMMSQQNTLGNMYSMYDCNKQKTNVVEECIQIAKEKNPKAFEILLESKFQNNLDLTFKKNLDKKCLDFKTNTKSQQWDPKFLFECPKLCKQTLGNMLGLKANVSLCKDFMSQFVFPKDVIEALELLVSKTNLPKEGQAVDRLIEAFSVEFSKQQQRSKDEVYMLAFAILMLNTDQHNKKVKAKMTLELFSNMLSDYQFDCEEIYYRIQKNPITELKVFERTKLESNSPGSILDFDVEVVDVFSFCIASKVPKISSKLPLDKRHLPLLCYSLLREKNDERIFELIMYCFNNNLCPYLSQVRVYNIHLDLRKSIFDLFIQQDNTLKSILKNLPINDLFLSISIDFLKLKEPSEFILEWITRILCFYKRGFDDDVEKMITSTDHGIACYLRLIQYFSVKKMDIPKSVVPYLSTKHLRIICPNLKSRFFISCLQGSIKTFLKLLGFASVVEYDSDSIQILLQHISQYIQNNIEHQQQILASMDPLFLVCKKFEVADLFIWFFAAYFVSFECIEKYLVDLTLFEFQRTIQNVLIPLSNKQDPKKVCEFLILFLFRYPMYLSSVLNKVIGHFISLRQNDLLLQFLRTLFHKKYFDDEQIWQETWIQTKHLFPNLQEEFFPGSIPKNDFFISL